MKKANKISKIVDSIVKKCAPEKIFLFGSYAYGNPNKNSDIDLFIIAEIPGLQAERMRIVRRALKEQGPIDIIVRTPKEVQHSLAGRDWFVQDIMQRGKLIYAR